MHQIFLCNLTLMWQYCNDWICCPKFYWPHTMTEISFRYQFCSYKRNPLPVKGIYLPVYWILSWFVMFCTIICLHHSNKYHKIYFKVQDTIKTSLGKQKLKVCDLPPKFPVRIEYFLPSPGISHPCHHTLSA